ncbi:MAG TPA: TldD/PmbA family protein [Anaerolineales bacterium]|nr:TldD/PmbA family protein [Anaerolineales bacterium]
MTDLKLPAVMAELRPALGNIVAQGHEQAPYFAVLLSSKHGLQITIDNREERVAERLPSAGTVLSAFDGQTIYERAVTGFDPNEVQRAARELVQGRSFAQYTPPAGSEPQRRGDFAPAVQIDPDDLSIGEKLERCRELHRRVKGRNSHIMNVQLRYVEGGEYAVFASQYADLAQRVQRVHLLLVVIVAGDDGQVQYDYVIKAGGAGWEVIDFTDEEIQSLVDGALALLSAERIEPGEYQVIAAPGVSGVICHESFGHGVETDMFLKQRARAAHFIDQTVGSPLVNIFDDPSQPGGFGSYFFDDEGRMASPTQIVENGLFRRGITDLYSATALNIQRSANGRRQDYSRKAYARMSNTYFGPGSSSFEDMLAQVDSGIYLEKWSSGMEDPQGWGIQVTCHYGHEIKGGRITNRLFAPIGISGYVPDVLQGITAVSKEWRLEAGHCGKGHKEIIPVASGGPYMLLKARLG